MVLLLAALAAAEEEVVGAEAFDLLLLLLLLADVVAAAPFCCCCCCEALLCAAAADAVPTLRSAKKGGEKIFQFNSIDPSVETAAAGRQMSQIVDRATMNGDGECIQVSERL